MAKSASEYEKLPGKRGRFLVYHRLYLGEGHLLEVSGRLFTETYKRFYFKDIQAIVCRKSGRGTAWTVVLASIGLLFTLPILLSKMDANPFWFFATLFFAVLLVIHVLYGPTSECHVRTAVQGERLLSLGRMRQAERVLARLTPMIEAVQGEVDRETIRSSDLAFDSSGEAGGAMDLAGRPLRHEPGRFHQFLFLWMGLEAATTGLRFLSDHLVLVLAGQAVTILLPIFVIIALVKQAGSDIGAGAKGTAWASGAYAALNFIVGYIVYIVMIMDSPRLGDNPLDALNAAMEVGPHSNEVMLGLYIVFLAASSLLTLSGLISLARRPSAGKATE